MSEARIINADCLDWMREQPSDSVDLVFGSPPYEAARTYGIGFKLKGQAWVDWMVERIVEMVRICKGLVAMVVEGQTRNFRWSATPALLMADLHRAGVHLRKPPAFYRVGVCGSGGQRAQHEANGGSADWLRNDYEFVVCCTKGGKLPWADTLAMGHKPKYGPGGEMSNRTTNGSRVNQWGHSIDSGATVVDGDGVIRSRGCRPSHRDQWGSTGHATGMQGRHENGKHKTRKRLERGNEKGAALVVPAIANPGNVIHCLVGGGVMGSDLAHENEAPFPERLAEFFVRSFCPPDGIVLDPFSGSGTTARVAQRFGRGFIAIDVRQSQCELTQRRLNEPERNGKPHKKQAKPIAGQRSLFDS